MKKAILAGTLLLCPVLGFADTITMRSGARFTGTFNSANQQNITFTDTNGNRQVLNVNDVQELRFDRANGGLQNGNGNNGSFNNTSGGNAGNYRNNDNGNYNNANDTNGAAADTLDRLQGDVQRATDNANLSDDQRQSLNLSRDTLRQAAQQSRNGQQMNSNNVRLALENIRTVMNNSGISQRDRDAVMNDLRDAGSLIQNNRNQFGRPGRNY